MLGDSAVLGTGGGSSADTVAAVAVPASAGGAHDGADTSAGGGGGGGGSNSGDDERFRGEESDRSFGGNRWPRQETLALLKIRSDMDVAFRDASVKGPLWEEVSRKMAELGYQRNAKKCKEKFENVYKYHKRTKEGRTGKSEGKTYRFFDQLEALENNPSIQIHSPTIPSNSKPPQTAPLPATPVSIVLTNPNSNPIIPPPTTTIATVQFPPPISVPPHSTSTVPLPTLPIPPMSQGFTNNTTNPTFFPTANPTYPSFDDLLSNSSSSSTSSDKTFEEEGRRRRKRKWKDFFEGLMKEVIRKQEEMQKGFLEAIEKREQERLVREEAWRMQEMQRINKEREILAQERSIAQAKDAAVMAFLQKIAEQQNLGPALSNLNNSTPVPPPLTQTTALAPVNEPVVAPHEEQQTNPQVEKSQPQPHQQANMEMVRVDNNGENLTAGMSSSRWPKVEVEALINLRKSLDTKYQENGPKGPLWEEISGLMKKMGYNRNAKRCKEKWENINKYFKKVKESNKKRPEDSKTCPYFHQLDALYKEKNKLETSFKPENTMAPLMVRPEQQWPPQQQQAGAAVPDVSMRDAQNDPMEAQHRHGGEDNEDNDDRDMEDYDEDEDEDEDEDDDDGGNKYEIVASKPPSADASA